MSYRSLERKDQLAAMRADRVLSQILNEYPEVSEHCMVAEDPGLMAPNATTSGQCRRFAYEIIYELKRQNIPCGILHTQCCNKEEVGLELKEEFREGQRDAHTVVEVICFEPGSQQQICAVIDASFFPRAGPIPRDRYWGLLSQVYKGTSESVDVWDDIERRHVLYKIP